MRLVSLAASGRGLAFAGLYGVIAYFVTQRTPEMDCASPSALASDVVRMVIGQALRLVMVGIFIGIPRRLC